MNLKSIHIIRLLLLIVFLIFISCNEELYDIKDKHSFEDKNKISLTQFKKETSINKVDPMLNLSAETAFEENEIAPTPDFIIDTLAIKRYISADNKTSYTFRIYPISSIAQPLEIYNLVYHKVGNSWETSIFYLKKLPNENSEHKLFEKIEKINTGKVSYTVASDFQTCSFETINYHCTDPGICDGSVECDLCSDCVSRYVTYTSCESGGSAGGGVSDPGSVSGGGGVSDPFAYSPNMLDNPVFDDPNYVNAVKAQSFFRQLANIAGAQQWANENADAYNQIIQYQIDNKWSSASASFANDIIDSSRLLEINAMEVWNDYDNFVNQMSISEKSIFNKLQAKRKLWYMVSAKKAFDKANELFPNSTYNGKGDAFRHALWNGYCSLTLEGNLGEQLTTAHESRPSSYTFNYKETEMDLYNNEKGRQIALISNLSNIVDNILNDLNNGFLRYLNNLNQSLDPNFHNRATYNSVLIPTDQ